MHMVHQHTLPGRFGITVGNNNGVIGDTTGITIAVGATVTVGMGTSGSVLRAATPSQLELASRNVHSCGRCCLRHVTLLNLASRMEMTPVSWMPLAVLLELASQLEYATGDTVVVGAGVTVGTVGFVYPTSLSLLELATQIDMNTIVVVTATRVCPVAVGADVPVGMGTTVVDIAAASLSPMELASRLE